ncbi:hypothetical protein LTR62_000821 [Meristemomyces frigidus]|uniref:Uncharacterized protein n=1 Tax=Meristemomyces frigidus TaxID=1508187 RepID=A0AAN7TL08_9PEZI|nr:hypothetical protein LTR62_000821 [Meristemomyces frigidus]
MAESEPASISGLREQIKANATHLFPAITETYTASHQASNTYLHIPPTTAFEVLLLTVAIVTPSNAETGGSLSKKRSASAIEQQTSKTKNFQAWLTYSTPAGTKRGAQGTAAGSVVEALESLLEVTGRALAAKSLAVLNGESIGRWRPYGEGFVDDESAVS